MITAAKRLFRSLPKVHRVYAYIARLEAEKAELARINSELNQERDSLIRQNAVASREIERSRQEVALVQSKCQGLEGQAFAMRIANDNLNALIVGKLSLLDYRIQSLRSSRAASSPEGRTQYLDLLEKALLGYLTDDPSSGPGGKFDADVRAVGRDWPATAHTMIGTVRLRNVRHLLERVIEEGIPGDVIETGVWRGGACIYMRAILSAYGISDRIVWVADSFNGLPKPNEARFPADRGDIHHTFDFLAVPLAQVKKNFDRYGLLDDRVRFLAGWFKETLPTAPIERLALLRLDGDMYESTIQALDALYPRLSEGGYVIIDDYLLPPCREAVESYRAQHTITATIEPIDGAAVFWRK